MLVNDVVTLGNASITQSIGAANQSQGFNGLDGIIGLGPDILTQQSLPADPTAEIPTVTDVSSAFYYRSNSFTENVSEPREARKGRSSPRWNIHSPYNRHGI
jgi:hypothetical protein